MVNFLLEVPYQSISFILQSSWKIKKIKQYLSNIYHYHISIKTFEKSYYLDQF